MNIKDKIHIQVRDKVEDYIANAINHSFEDKVRLGLRNEVWIVVATQIRHPIWAQLEDDQNDKR